MSVWTTRAWSDRAVPRFSDLMLTGTTAAIRAPREQLVVKGVIDLACPATRLITADDDRAQVVLGRLVRKVVVGGGGVEVVGGHSRILALMGPCKG